MTKTPFARRGLGAAVHRRRGKRIVEVGYRLQSCWRNGSVTSTVVLSRRRHPVVAEALCSHTPGGLAAR